MMNYELIPTNGQKSFYGKAVVKVDSAAGCGLNRPSARRRKTGIRPGASWTGATVQGLQDIIGGRWMNPATDNNPFKS